MPGIYAYIAFSRCNLEKKSKSRACYSPSCVPVQSNANSAMPSWKFNCASCARCTKTCIFVHTAFVRGSVFPMKRHACVLLWKHIYVWIKVCLEEHLESLKISTTCGCIRIYVCMHCVWINVCMYAFILVKLTKWLILRKLWLLITESHNYLEIVKFWKFVN